MVHVPIALFAVLALMSGHLTSLAAAETTGELLGPFMTPESLGLSQEFAVFPLRSQPREYGIAPKAAVLSNDGSRARFGIQYVDVGKPGAAASMTLSLNLDVPADDLEELTNFISSTHGGSIRLSQFFVEADFFFLDDDKVMQIVSLDVGGENGGGVTLPAGAELPLVIDLTVVGGATPMLEVLSGARPAGILLKTRLDSALQSVLQVDGSILNSAGPMLNEIVSVVELEEFIVEQLSANKLYDVELAVTLQRAIQGILPPETVMVDSVGYDFELGWDVMDVRIALAKIDDDTFRAMQSRSRPVNFGTVFEFRDFCSEFPDLIVDLSTFSTGCEGLRR